ncbi:hypothetical protein [Rhodopirellula halodulae]|nr:hypothetical protein [Rhodopirellula sp. JC737]
MSEVTTALLGVFVAQSVFEGIELCNKWLRVVGIRVIENNGMY